MSGGLKSSDTLAGGREDRLVVLFVFGGGGTECTTGHGEAAW